MREYQQIINRFRKEWASSEGSQVLQEIASRCKDKAIQMLRMRILHPIAFLDVKGRTLVYGGELPGAEAVGSKPVECDTLIHLSHALSADDLRERGIQAQRILRYRIEGIDGVAWDRQNQPAHWPFDRSDWLRLAQERWEQERVWNVE
jgi:hypothetical protein